jgi:outer membrane protein OmpA-like peptidoglycan-associated protein
MKISLRAIGLYAVICVLLSRVASGQPPDPSLTTQPDATTRPSTMTPVGDTGLWFVPTADVLPRHKWSGGGFRSGFTFKQGFTSVNELNGTVAFGAFQYMEIFGAVTVVRSLNRNLRPLFTADSGVGGSDVNFPQLNMGWTGNHFGDIYVGLKSQLLTEERGRPFSLAIREFVKIPTADSDIGIGTGKVDTSVQGVISKEVNKVVVLSGYGGVRIRAKASALEIPNTASWGVGAGFPSRSQLRVTTEVNGEIPFSSTSIRSIPLNGDEGSRAPVSQDVWSFTAATAGLTYQWRNGFFVGGGVGFDFPRMSANGVSLDPGRASNFVNYEIRFGFHPGVRVYAPPPPPPPPPPPLPPPPPPPPAPRRNPTVRGNCGACSVVAGGTLAMSADGQSPEGDQVSYRWSAPAGTFQNATNRQTIWTAPQQEGAVPITVTVDDGKGGTGSDTVTIQVTRPAPVVELNFEDVYFEFDRSTLRPDALRLLDDAVTRLQANPNRNIIIEGHTCNIGTAEYNLALGERRAASVRDYLISRGIPASRLETRSYGEENPKYDNAREETRRLNRRAVLVVKVQ